MLNLLAETSLNIAARLELPGEGNVSICRDGEGRFALNCQ